MEAGSRSGVRQTKLSLDCFVLVLTADLESCRVWKSLDGTLTDSGMRHSA